MTKQPMTVEAPERTCYSFKQMFDTGLLWYINATCFHPHGLALAIENPDDPIGWSLHADMNGSPFMFDHADPEITHKFARFQALVAQARADGVAPEGGHPAFPARGADHDA